MKNFIKNSIFAIIGITIFTIYISLLTYMNLPNPFYILSIFTLIIIILETIKKTQSNLIKLINIFSFIFFIIIINFSIYSFIISFSKTDIVSKYALQPTQVNKNCKVKGSILLEENKNLKKLSNIDLKLAISDGKTNQTKLLKTDINGEYQFSLNPGIYRIFIQVLNNQKGFIPVYSKPIFSYYEISNLNPINNGPKIIFKKPLKIKGLKNNIKLPKKDLKINWENKNDDVLYRITINKINKESSSSGVFIKKASVSFSEKLYKVLLKPEYLLKLSEFEEGKYTLNIEVNKIGNLYNRTFQIDFFVKK